MRMHCAVAPLRARAWIWVLTSAVALAVAGVILLLWNTGGGSARDERLTGTRTLSVVSSFDAAAGNLDIVPPLTQLIRSAPRSARPVAATALPAELPVGRTPAAGDGGRPDSAGPGTDRGTSVQPVTPVPTTGGTGGAVTPPVLPPVHDPAPVLPAPVPGGGAAALPEPGAIDVAMVPGIVADAIGSIDTPLLSVTVDADSSTSISVELNHDALAAAVGDLSAGTALPVGGG